MAEYPPRNELPPLAALCLNYTEDIHRPPGDPLNALSFKFPLIYETITSGTLWNIVSAESYPDSLVEEFETACQRAADRGAVGIITSCGFLAQMQKRLSTKSPIPIASSSLVQLPLILNMRGNQEHVGVLTFDASNLGMTQFSGVGVTEEMMKRITVEGCTKDGPLRGIIQRGDPYVEEELETELIERAHALVERDPKITVIILECTQMPRYAAAISKATGLPVYDVVTMIDWFYSGLVCRSFVRDDFKDEGLRQRKRSEKELTP